MNVGSALLAMSLMSITASSLAAEPAEPRRRTDDKVLLMFVPEDDEGFITKADLASLGCAVEKVSGAYADTPLRGTRAFRMKNKEECTVDLLTTITELRYAKADVVGLWTEEDKNSQRRAKKCKGAAVVSEGSSGEKSRLTIYPGTGDKCGFKYIVQDRGYLYELASYGALQMTPELAKIVQAKVDGLVSGQYVGVFDRTE